MLMRDDHFGHRRPDDGMALKNVDKDTWIPWDFAIESAFQTVEYYTDSHGIFQWYKEDPEERIDAKRKIDPFQAGVDRITSGKNYKRSPGEYFVPDVKSGREDGSMQTFMEWRNANRDEMLKEMSESADDGKIE